MEKFVVVLSLIPVLFLNCLSSSEELLPTTTEESIIVVDFYRSTFSKQGGSVSFIYLKKDSLIIVRQFKKESLLHGISPLPPSPNNYDDNALSPIQNRLRNSSVDICIQDEIIYINKKQVEMLHSLLNTFTALDFTSMINLDGHFDDSVLVDVFILFGYSKIEAFTIVNKVSANQKRFLKYFFNIVIENSLLNKNELELLLNR